MNPASLLRTWGTAYLMDHQNKSMAMQRAASAQAQGLDPGFGVPLPGSTVTTTNNIKGGGWWQGAILTALALTLGAGGAGLILKGVTSVPASSSPSSSSPPTSPSLPTPPVLSPGWDAIYEQQDPKTGEWKQIRREHLK